MIEMGPMESWVRDHAHSVHPQDGAGYGPNARIRIVAADDVEVVAREQDAKQAALVQALETLLPFAPNDMGVARAAKEAARAALAAVRGVEAQ